MDAPAVVLGETLAPPAQGLFLVGAESRFHIASLAFQRARQLKAGARPRVEQEGHTLVRLAQLEVMAGLISWERMATREA